MFAHGLHGYHSMSALVTPPAGCGPSIAFRYFTALTGHSLALAALMSTLMSATAVCAQSHALTTSTLVQSKPLSKRTSADINAFHMLSADQTGVDFESRIDFDHRRRQLYMHGFAGGGVCIGDYDNDGRPDIFLSGQTCPNRLYRQTADFQFEDVTEKTGVDGNGAWSSGATFIDIDNDGDLDLFVCAYDSPNQLYINQGDGAFTESAAAFGLDYAGASIMAAFADYDRDGLLDMYLLTNRIYAPLGESESPQIVHGENGPVVTPEFADTHQVQTRIIDGQKQYFIVQAGQPDRLYRNNGNNTFTDVTASAGISGNAAGLSATWWDANGDNWPDLYVGNDYWDADCFYVNNGDPGTPRFTDMIEASMPHTSWFSMGADYADINNDGMLDFLSADMSATTHFTAKITMGDMSDSRWFLMSAQPRQYMRNALYLNSGTQHFLEAAFLAGLASTDWTWSVKFADFDNDGWSDVFFTNGTANQSFDSDFNTRTKSLAAELDRNPRLSPLQRDLAQWELFRQQPLREETNLAFHNTGDLHFDNVSTQWGLDNRGLSYAASTADLDRDGDLDLVVGNLNQPVSVYRNDLRTGHAVQIRLAGTQSNRFGIGATINATTGNMSQTQFLTATRGYMSANEPMVHLGLGDANRIDKLTIHWPGGHLQTLTNLSADRIYTITEPDAPAQRSKPGRPERRALFADVTEQTGLSVPHIEQPYDDYAGQPLLPAALSQLGPGVAFGDADGDGDDDVFVAGAAGKPGTLLINNLSQFTPVTTGPWTESADVAAEDMAPLWLDVDADGDLDLYVGSGSYEFPAGDLRQRDRLYINDGAGRFTNAPDGALPDRREVTSAVVAADFDRDGDLDVFVGARVIPGQYPETPASALLQNNAGRFTDMSGRIAPGLQNVGLVTSALWSDVDADGWIDLLVACEWGPIKLFRNDKGRLIDATASAGLAERTGWWTSITGGDFDADGDIDFAALNIGLNTKYKADAAHPTRIYYGDFEGNGKKHIVEAKSSSDTLLPVRGRSCSSNAMPFVANKFPTYRAFASAKLTDIYSPQCLTDALELSAVELRSGILVNDGTGRFTFDPLPPIVQIAPGYGVCATDFNTDGATDLFIAQNFFGREPETGHLDGGLGVLMLGEPMRARGSASAERGPHAGAMAGVHQSNDKKPYVLSHDADDDSGTAIRFRPVWPDESGLIIPGDATAAAVWDRNNDARPDILVARNSDRTIAFESQASRTAGTTGKALAVRLNGSSAGNRSCAGATILAVHADGTKIATELYAGAGYLSQSGPVAYFGTAPSNPVVSVRIRWPDGSTSKHPLSAAARNRGSITLVQPSQ